MKKLRLLDCFSGIGGFSYAAERIVGGFETVAFVECESYCQQILRKHWPDIPIHDDITTFKPKPHSADVVCGGFPCQDISAAGKKAGIQKGTRSGLFYELMRVVRMVRPKFIILENVSAILANGLDTVLAELAQAGFDAEWACIPASAVGACHRRDRWWLVAYSIGTRLEGKSLWGRLPAESLYSDWRKYISQPVLHRGDDGLSDRVDRIRSLGNAVVPQVAAIPLARVQHLSMLLHVNE
jgi:DNA (cytosine-5)-methyltransferase 1